MVQGYKQLSLTERKVGTVEGNVYYVESLLASMQTLKTRLENLDEALVDTVMAKVALLPACNTVKAESDELDMVRQLTFVSGLDEGKIRSLLADASEDGDDKAKRKRLDKLIESFIKGPQLSTSEMTRMLMQASLIVIDAERFFGSPGTFKGTLDNDLKAKFDKVKNIAAQDLGKYTVPFTGTKPVDEDGNYAPQFESAGVAIVGGGPIGLMAAVESRLAGASLVNVYEGRSDPYSRMNVLTVDDSVARFKKNGVYEAIFPNGPGPKGHVASVKTIENALQARAESLGIELQREKFLENVEKDPKTGRTLLYFKGPEGAPPLECDLLILATGASVVSAKKHADNIALSDKLGINFSKSDVKDFAGVGYFDVDSEELPEGQERQPTDGWTYDFVTSEVKYLVTGLTEEEFNDYTLNPQKLVERLREDAEKVLLAKKESEFAKNEQGEDYQPLKFEIGIQQAQQFSTDDMGSVLVGDSAGTPHPSTGKGLNTGIAEMGAIHDLVKRVGTEHGQGPQDEETRKKAMQMYEAELKKRTNIVVDLGLNAIQDKSANHCTSFIRKFKRQVLDGVEGLGQLLGDNVMEKFTAHVNSLKTSVEDRKNDHDWKKREAGTKAIRAFEKQMQIVAQEIEALIAFQGLPQEDDQRQELGPAIVQKLRNLVPTV